MSTSLTPAQQAVVAHDRGPALVFAAAGSGKTTTMVARIARLVQDGVFPASQILATSFNRAAADAIEGALRKRGVKDVQVKTLHSFGYQLVSLAQQQGLLHVDLDRARRGFETLDRHLLHRALAEARRRHVPYAKDLINLDLDGFLDYVARCKGNLRYADLSTAQLPAAALTIAGQAAAPADTPFFLPLYQLYEDLRRQLGWITYDDMLMSGWEVLARHPQIQDQMQREIRCVIVDEFQDVNLVQVELIDRVSSSHRNLMVIGDDDQTIYEWRGAAARFILGFQQRHNASVYLLQENFRCKASQVALANAVILHNLERSPKQLKLTQGFDGGTSLQRHADEESMAAAIVADIQRLRRPPDEVAVLVRLFAQTAPIEAALSAAGIPYRVEGDLPFYRRPEVMALVDYVRLAKLENQMQAGSALSAEDVEHFRQWWGSVVNRPLRYLSRAWIDSCADAVIQRKLPPSAALAAVAQDAPDNVADKLHRLSEDLRWLAERTSTPGTAHKLFFELERRLGYAEAMGRGAGDDALGLARVAAVKALLKMAEGAGSVDRFLRELDASAKPKRGKQPPAVTITTIFRAKGLEWPVVIVPGCNEGLLPYERGFAVAEERRLLYVAITRAQQQLFLHAVNDRPLSSFLVEAETDAVLATVDQVRQLLSADPARWNDTEALTVAVAAKRLGWDEFLVRWWTDDRRV
ncbi:MAG: ATP-dependent helicase, partial [Caldilineaceae bacterium]|nr:ATP-dependent helicase [Caldilineaceae bacterium]